MIFRLFNPDSERGHFRSESYFVAGFDGFHFFSAINLSISPSIISPFSKMFN